MQRDITVSANLRIAVSQSYGIVIGNNMEDSDKRESDIPDVTDA